MRRIHMSEVKANVRAKVADFLKEYGMDLVSIDMDKNMNLFVEEMERGLDGRSSSLMMIPTYISMDKQLPEDEPVIVIDAGGTNLRVAVIHFDTAKKPVVEDFKLYSMPGTKGEISKDEFFDTLASYLMPIIDKSSKISFCFSYPATILPNKDGKLIKFSKEVKVRDMKGVAIGENLLQALKKHGCKDDKSIILLNDTVATLLAGKASAPDRVFDSYIGFILGTGTNTCYIEKSSNIVKVPGLEGSDGSMLINVESGDYNKVARGRIDEEFDQTTANPGNFIFEKTISGAYQGGLILSVIRKAAENGLFTNGFLSKLAALKELSGKEIDDFLFYPYEGNTLAMMCGAKDEEEDRLVLYYIIDAVIERAAKFVAYNLTAVVLKTGKGTNPLVPICITADGSTFYKSKLFRGKLDYYIRTFTNDDKKVYCEFVKVDNGTLIGTAIAGLLN